MIKPITLFAALMVSITAFASEIELKNCEDRILPSLGEKKFAMKEGRCLNLEPNATYKVSFELIKEKGAKNSSVALYSFLSDETKAQFSDELKTKFANQKGVNFVTLGNDVPDDGKPYKCEDIFVVPADEWFSNNIRIGFYNKYAPEGLNASFKDFKIEKIEDIYDLNLIPAGLQYPIEMTGKGVNTFYAEKFPLLKLQKGQKYSMKFEVQKGEAKDGVYAAIIGRDTEKKEKAVLNQIAGKIPHDGEFHEVECTFTIPEDFNNLFIFLYNRNSTTKSTFKNFEIKKVIDSKE